MKNKKSMLTMLLVPAVVFSLAGCRPRQNSETANTNAAGNPEAAPIGGTLTTGDAYHFSGTINGNLKIEMALTRDGERLIGTYFYPKVGKTINLRGTIDKNDNVELRESDDTGADTGIFKGKWKPSSTEAELDLVDIEGKWSKPDGTKQTAFVVTEQPIMFTGPQKIIPKQIKEANKEKHYSLDADYPQIEGGNAQADKFNKEARALVTKHVTDWKANETELSTDMPEDLPESTGDSEVGISYVVRYATDDLVSIEFTEDGMSRGAAHPSMTTFVLNYDLRNGRKLGLGDLFKAKSTYLGVISAFCIKSLKEQSKKKELMLEDEQIESGAGPKADNYKVWAVTKKGLWITFDAYQVGPYAAGPQYVLVPYSTLKDLIEAGGPLGPISG